MKDFREEDSEFTCPQTYAPLQHLLTNPWVNGLEESRGAEGMDPGAGARLSERACLAHLSLSPELNKEAPLARILPWTLRCVNSCVKPHSGRVALVSSQGEQKGVLQQGIQAKAGERSERIHCNN